VRFCILLSCDCSLGIYSILESVSGILPTLALRKLPITLVRLFCFFYESVMTILSIINNYVRFFNFLLSKSCAFRSIYSEFLQCGWRKRSRVLSQGDCSSAIFDRLCLLSLVSSAIAHRSCKKTMLVQPEIHFVLYASVIIDLLYL